MLAELLRAHGRADAEGAGDDPDRRFAAEQNARLAVDAEGYHRASFRGGAETWNLRDRHMAGRLAALLRHLDERNGAHAKVAVWAHNSHGSWEDLLHRAGADRFLLMPPDLPGRRLERAIGVISLPETERRSHCFEARMADRFDAVIHLDRTSAVEPLERTEAWDRGEPVEPGALVG